MKPRAPKKILIVEDERSLREILKTRLSTAGYVTMAAQNGAVGLRLAIEKKPDLILLDIIMPHMDGVTMLRKLRAHENGRKVPVIILTNLSEGPFVDEAINEGVIDFLVKSNWTLAEIIREVKKKLG